MCRYAETVYKVHYVCVPCRRSVKNTWDGAEHRCPECGEPMLFAGHDFAAPPRRDGSGWVAVAAVLAAGLTYDGFELCGCGREPRFRPRTSAAVRARRRVAGRAGAPEAEALAVRHPHDLLG
jgi:DNA-directed RNA polymerase subunit RPC12/RpoP